MKKVLVSVLGLVSVATLVTGCQTMNNSIHEKPIGIANPASIFCVNQGGQSFIKKDSQGAEAGYCRLANDTVVDEWDFFRKNSK